MRFLLLALLLGCPSKGPKDPSFTAAGPKPCEKMADHLVGLMQPHDADGKPMKQETETADAITRVLIERCSKDAWTEDAQKCFIGLADLAGADKCAPLLTVDQRNHADEAMASALGSKPPPTAGSGSGAP